MKIYWQILKKYTSSLILCPLLVLIFVICETTMPTLMAKIVDEGVMQKDLQVVTRIGLYMLAISAVGLLANIANIYISSRASVGFGTDLRSKLFGKVQEFSFSEIDKFNPASLITRLTGDITRIQQVLQISLRLLLRAPLMMAMALFFVIRIDSRLALIVAAVIPILAIGTYIIMKRGLPLFLKVQQKIDKLNSVVRENLINIRVVKSFTREESEIGKFSKSNEELRDTSIRASNVVIIYFPLMQSIMNLSLIVILWVGGHKIASEELMIGELISLINYLMQIMMSLMILSMVIVSFARAAASSQRIVEVLETDPSVKDEPERYPMALHNHSSEKNKILFRNVHFRYPQGDEDILQDISLSIPKGSIVAIAGATGSGKSSLVQLIPRLYDITKGEISIDGHDIRSYPLDELHKMVGMVLQKNELFSGTIEENLRWGKEDATTEEIEKAAEIAQAHNFITSFKDGYKTILGRGGINVSGGQKQRICIARALLRQPEILILDDSTSAVDINTEMEILDGLRANLKGTTILIVTQRISTMERADTIVILEDGKIEAIGNPKEIKERSPIYKEICSSQQLTV